MTKEARWILDEKYGGVESEAFHADCERLKEGEPLAYIIGSVPFLDTIVYLDSHPLIPRPETEFWVEKAIAHIKQSLGGPTPKLVKVLDLCAGSGCIGVAVLKAVPEANVDFVEMDQNHLSTIKKNLEINLETQRTKASKYSNRLEYFEVIESDLFENVKDCYDFILTNPPYIDLSLDRVETSVKENEPDLALYGGKNGMQCITDIIKKAPQYLTDGGILYIEHEPEQRKLIQELARANNFKVTTHRDQYEIERYSILTLKSS